MKAISTNDLFNRLLKLVDTVQKRIGATHSAIVFYDLVTGSIEGLCNNESDLIRVAKMLEDYARQLREKDAKKKEAANG